MEIIRDFRETAQLDSIVVFLVVRDALQVTCQAFGTVVLEAHVMRGSRSFGYNTHPVRIVFPDCFCAPRPATEGKLEIRILVFLPGRETTGFSKSFGRKQSKREWNCNASMRFKLERDIRQLLAVGRTVKTMDESFYLSNMCPQLPECNRGPWKDLESKVRDFAIKEKDVYIVTGPILSDTNMKTIGTNKVTVPKRFYKVVWDRTPPEKMIGFILPNSGSTKNLQDFAVTVNEVELETGLDFFSKLPKEQQETLESTLTVNAWPWN